LFTAEFNDEAIAQMFFPNNSIARRDTILVADFVESNLEKILTR